MIEVSHLHISYPDGTRAIDDVSFSIGDGECVALIGANGAGKSTLFLSLVGMLAPSEGSIRIDGEPVEKRTLASIRKRVGLVFQNPDDQLFMATIYDDLAFGPRNYGMDETAIEERVGEVLESLCASHLRDKTPFKLSGGEKRLAALGSVLVLKPSVMLLDEPSSFLDPKARRNLISILGALPMTRLIATHDMDLALSVCRRVIILKDGRLFADGDAKTLLHDSALLDECGLEPPLCLIYKEERP